MNTKSFTAEQVATMLGLTPAQFDFEAALRRIAPPDRYEDGIAKWTGLTVASLIGERNGPARSLTDLAMTLARINQATGGTP